MKHRSTRSSQGGFTLIELLVVIAIIAILAAILFPVFARAREKARQTACLSNVKQLVLGLVQYVQDYDEMLPVWYNFRNPPGSKYWSETVQPYVKNKQVLVCASDGTPYSAGGPVSYGYNCDYLGYGSSSSTGFYALPKVTKPAETVWIMDCVQSCAYSPGRWVPDVTNTLYVYYLEDSQRHNGGANVGFVDGHAKWLISNDLLMDNSIWDRE